MDRPFLLSRGHVMAKAPAIQFYVKDWLSDPELRMASHSTKGIWIDMLCYMWESSERGRLRGNFVQIQKLVSATDKDIHTFMDEAMTLKFCDVTERNNFVTITNRRMYQDYLNKQNTRLRVQRYRKKQKCNIDVTPSSPSPSPTPPIKNKERAVFIPDNFEKFYSEYPVHTGKTPALEKWKKKLKDGTLPELNILLEAIRRQNVWRENTTEFRPAWKNPASWLHQECWTDEMTSYGGTKNGNNRKFTSEKPISRQDREQNDEAERINREYREAKARKAAGEAVRST